MRKLLTTGALAAASLGFAINPAGAATQQEGLVNVNLEGINVQAPIGVAANLCDISANVLAQQLGDGPAHCDAEALPEATWGGPKGGNAKQEGLVNVNVADVNVQAPIGVAANICDVDVNVLTRQLVLPGVPTCDAVADPIANA